MKVKTNYTTTEVIDEDDLPNSGGVYVDSEGDLVVVDVEKENGAVVFLRNGEEGFVHYDSGKLDSLAYPLTSVPSITIEA